MFGLTRLQNELRAMRGLDGWAARLGYAGFRLGLGREPEAALAVRGLPRPVVLRRGTSDAAVFRDTFGGRFHRPPPGLVADPDVVVDMGANIGTTMLDFSRVWPGARIVGVEPDPDNAELCRRNLSQDDRSLDLIEAAIWTTAGVTEIARWPGGEWGSTIVDRWGNGERVEVETRRVGDVLQEAGRGRTVDYVKMDIEGAEAEVLKTAADWSDQVRVLAVEIHEPYTLGECARDLERAGFRIVRATAGAPPSVVAKRAAA